MSGSKNVTVYYVEEGDKVVLGDGRRETDAEIHGEVVDVQEDHTVTVINGFGTAYQVQPGEDKSSEFVDTPEGFDELGYFAVFIGEEEQASYTLTEDGKVFCHQASYSTEVENKVE